MGKLNALLIRDGREFALIGGVVLILIVLFSPIPPLLLDLALLINFGLSLTILLLTLHVAKPVEFSTFPSLLLISTLLRLALNIAATRLILTNAEAGEVIGSIGSYAVGGNFVVGLVVFFILVVVQYVVVTSGAQRVSEVAARFTLDSMPGQQMSIDADLNMGLIDQKEAVRRRAALEKEAAFYGAMDGASKFVKGDAIAGVIILLIDIIAGWIIGMAQMGMAWDEALAHFTLLTIGDGIATQLPALIISTATGIIVTRSSADRQLSTEVFQQLSSAPRIPIIVAGLLVLLMLLPGMPKWPILLVTALAYLTWRQARRRKKDAPDENAETSSGGAGTSAPNVLVVALGPKLANEWSGAKAMIMDRINALREAQERLLGVAFPALSLIDDSRIGPFEYEIRLFGARFAGGETRPSQMLAIRSDASRRKLEGAETFDPAFGLPALWIEQARCEEAREAGYTLVDPTTVFITHLGEVVRSEAPALLTRAAVVRLIEDVRQRQPGLVEELIPQPLALSDLQRVLQNLIGESVSIGSIDLIIEHLVDLARAERDPGQLTELLRQRLSHSICNTLRDRHRDLAVLSLDPRLENQITAAVAASARRDALALDPRLAERLLRKLAGGANEMMRQGREPVLLCGGEIRRQLRAMTRRTIPKLSVLGTGEIPASIDLRSHAVIRLDDAEPGREMQTPAPRQTAKEYDDAAFR
ncbi:MAG TPA: flagellar biosynthesis protein FlhA [Vitreimonas sp.]|uniref:flagellar biosynthesis protein FlhA n=1 Tax=Vitreimonas sp. TaxID=3069702 RepID=UPI002D5286BA|nr:flagellar biosynthesis protein FlhA [Vitreimonas sp.]HYD85977.1 flagellar biosynthesis protein FlhA [Vitreimonas sp.]